jgi:serine/threonine protein kinase
MDERPERLVLGKYRLLERLGRGGMGDVWRAEATGPAGFRRTVVLKRILPALAREPKFVERFVREARLSARLHHANIVQVFELDESEGEWFLAMEYLHGGDLRAVLEGAGAAFQPSHAAFVAREMCRALDYAYTLADESGQPLKLVHRDVSLSNVMLCFDGTVKLLDFGIAVALGDPRDRSSVSAVIGKATYMAPERLARGTTDHQCDLYSVGIVLHEALVGESLFQLGELDPARAARVRPPSEKNPHVPPALDRICMRALAPDPAQRYQSAAEMTAALDELVLELKAGSEQLASLLRTTFPRGVVPSSSRAALSTVRRPLPRRSWRRAAVGAALLLLGCAALIGVALHRRSPKTALAPAPVAQEPPRGAPIDPLPVALPALEPPRTAPIDPFPVVVHATPPPHLPARRGHPPRDPRANAPPATGTPRSRLDDGRLVSPFPQ